MTTPKNNQERQILTFETAAEWRAWLAENHQQSAGIWLRLFKVDSGVASVSRSEALDEALCFGWIDGQADKYDDKSWLQKYTPRRPKGLWSQRNIEHIARLTKLGKMTPAGQKEVDAAKADGRWQNAYSSQTVSELPADFLAELDQRPKAKAFFETLNKTNLFAIYFRLHTAKKPETRQRRMQAILEMLENGQKFH